MLSHAVFAFSVSGECNAKFLRFNFHGGFFLDLVLNDDGEDAEHHDDDVDIPRKLDGLHRFIKPDIADAGDQRICASHDHECTLERAADDDELLEEDARDDRDDNRAHEDHPWQGRHADGGENHGGKRTAEQRADQNRADAIDEIRQQTDNEADDDCADDRPNLRADESAEIVTQRGAE